MIKKDNIKEDKIPFNTDFSVKLQKNYKQLLDTNQNIEIQKRTNNSKNSKNIQSEYHKTHKLSLPRTKKRSTNKNYKYDEGDEFVDEAGIEERIKKLEDEQKSISTPQTHKKHEEPTETATATTTKKIREHTIDLLLEDGIEPITSPQESESKQIQEKEQSEQSKQIIQEEHKQEEEVLKEDPILIEENHKEEKLQENILEMIKKDIDLIKKCE